MRGKRVPFAVTTGMVRTRSPSISSARRLVGQHDGAAPVSPGSEGHAVHAAAHAKIGRSAGGDLDRFAVRGLAA